jgi:large subunit ribosomal protein L25
MHAVCPFIVEGGLSTIILKTKNKMKSISIKCTKREVVGKKEAKRLRVEGLVPGVLYGGEEPIHFYAPEKEFKPLIYTPHVYLVDLDIDGTVYQSIIQDKQFHPVEELLLHVDFLRTTADKMVKVEIPVKTEGFAKGIRKGGKLKLNLRTLKVKAMVKHLPDAIAINVDDLDLGQSYKVGSLVRENLEFLNAKAVPVVTIMITRAAKAAAGAGKK